MNIVALNNLTNTELRAAANILKLRNKKIFLL